MGRRKRTSRRRRNSGRFEEEEDLNPLSYMANMSDAMLILAVGIMLALIVHWNVDVSTTGGDMGADDTPYVDGEDTLDTENAVTFDNGDLEAVDDGENIEEGTGMDKLGEIYYDSATGKYYVIEQEEEE